MDYNTQRGKLIIREYGRNIQNLIDYTIGIKDKEKRNATANALVGLMGHLNPQYKNVEEFNHKLWDHLIIISQNKLKIDNPYPAPQKESEKKLLKRIPYPKKDILFKHYGKNVEFLVEKAIQMKDKEKQSAFVELIGAYMKMVHRVKSKENTTDEIVRTDLGRLSKGKLEVPEAVNFDIFIRASTKRKHTSRPPSKGGSFRKKNRKSY